MFCEIKDLKNESDVEQKLIFPLITTLIPMGLGFSPSDFMTKPNIKQIVIGKGKSEKIYFPDYVITNSGLPLLVIEAKSPHEDLDQALREAMLYTIELNSNYPTKLNPCRKIIVSNGNEIWASSWDSKVDVIKVKFSEINVTNVNYSRFVEFSNKTTLMNFNNKIFKLIRGLSDYKKPNLILGGKTVQFEELEQNTFGTTLAIDYRNLFNPVDRKDRNKIVRDAYIESKKRLKHVDPIEKIIRASKPPSITDAKHIENTSEPTEIINALDKRHSYKHELLLLIGSVGSGKSTFTDYLREVALPEEIRNDSIWLSIDLNNAPLDKSTIYNWLKEKIIEGLIFNFPEYDFEDIHQIKKVFSVEINKLKKGPGSLLNSEKFNELMAEHLYKLQNDINSNLSALIRYLFAEQGNILIIVLDNCDKRGKEDQLLMFDVAKWLKEEYECIVFLPIRDSTYDLHRKEPPLDTAIKDLVFRIDPPPLINVLYKRVNLALREMTKAGVSKYSYQLPNGIRVEYPASDQGMYLACILKSLFHSNVFFSRLISGIAGRNIRKGIEIFLDFCKSGHIREDEIFKMRQSKGQYELPNHIVSRVLIRGSRRFYHDSNSTIRNLFHSSANDILPDPFSRISILQWLRSMYTVPGPNNVKGYHKIFKLISELLPIGHDGEILKRELSVLIKTGCILTESQIEEDKFDDEDLIALAPAGIVHLDLLGNLDYLSSCSEDIWYKTHSYAESIAERISNKIGSGHHSISTSLENTSDLLNYLEIYKKNFFRIPDNFLINETTSDYLSISKNTLRKASNKMSLKSDLENLIKEYPPGKLIQGQIASIQPYGIFVDFGEDAKGLIHISNMGSSNVENFMFENFEFGDIINAEIIEFNTEHKRFKLKYLEL